jgi:hypothetical protein
MVARFFELLMYALFALAALPLALLEANALAFFLMNPEMIQDRDAALEVLAASMAIRYASYPFVPATLMALYFAVAGPRAVRINVAFLVLAFCVLSYLSSTFAFNTPGRLYLESASIALFAMLPIFFLVRRWNPSRERPNPTVERDARKSSARPSP